MTAEFYEPVDGPIVEELRRLGRFTRAEAQPILQRHFSAWRTFDRAKLIKRTNRYLSARCAEGRMLRVGTISTGPGGFRGWLYVALAEPIPISSNPRWRNLQPVPLVEHPEHQ